MQFHQTVSWENIAHSVLTEICAIRTCGVKHALLGTSSRNLCCTSELHALLRDEVPYMSELI